MANLTKLHKIQDSFTVYRCDNGYRFEAYGVNKKGDHKSVNLIINDEATLLDVIKEANAMERDE
jgi:hypothetical protein